MTANRSAKDKTDHLIIGNSASGISAAESIRKIDKEGRIMVVTEEKYTNYSKPLTTYYLAGKVSLDKISFKDSDYYRENDIDLLTGTRIVEVDDTVSQAKTSSGGIIEYGKLLIATGGRPIIPRIKMSAGKSKNPDNSGYLDGSNIESIKGIFTLTTLEDAVKIKKYIEENEIESAAILGGGLIGLKSAEAFLELGMEIDIIELADRILAATFDSQASGIIEDAIEARGSRIHKNNTIEEVYTASGRVTGYRLRDGSENTCRLLIMAIGVNPDLDILKTGNIKTGRGIKVDDKMQTNIKNIYASGDVVEGFDILLEENRNIAIWPLAVRQGNVAGSNMAGKKSSYSGGFFMNSVEILGIPSISMGITDLKMDDANTVQIKKEFRPDRKTYRKLVIRDNRIVGLIMVGNIERAGIYSGLIRNRIELSGIMDNISREDFGIIHLPADYKKHLVTGEGIEV